MTQQKETKLQRFNKTLVHERTQKYLGDVLGEKKSSFVANVSALVSNNAKLQECDAITVLNAGIKATSLDLPLDQNLGFAYVIPYYDKHTKTTLAQFQLGYKAFIQLALRSGQIETINTRDVREGEIKGEDFVSGEMIFERIKENRLKAKVIGYVGYFKMINGFRKTLYMTMEEVEEHGKKYSKAYGFMWKSDFDAMAKKTVIKLLLSKYAPLSVEMQNAISFDQAVFKDKNKPYYIDRPEVDGQEKARGILDEAMGDDGKKEDKEKKETKSEEIKTKTEPEGKINFGE